MPLNPVVAGVTRRIVERSRPRREDYLARIAIARDAGPHRRRLSCGNLAHGFAACGPSDKAALRGVKVPNIGIVTAYNDMLSAHQPYERYPELIRQAARDAGATAQVAGGVPTSSPCRPASRCRTTCSTPHCSSASATRSCRAC
jgi:phosphogluconate dehydratase